MNSIPYSQLAIIYDKVMFHVNYKMWTEYIFNLLRLSKINIKNVLDLSCGTGKHIQYLQKKKWHITGADLSFAMLRIAQTNLQNATGLVGNDARFCAFKNETFDVVLMLYDSINYMLTEQETLLLLSEVNRVLKRGGIFIFDFVTMRGLKDCYEDYYESNSWDGLAYERHSWFKKEHKIQHNDFLFLYNGHSFKEEHIQKIPDLNEWRNMIKKSEMQLSHEFSNFSLLPPDRKSERIHFVCRKLL